MFTTTKFQNETGWFQVGGTSLAAPVVAAIAADTGITLDPARIYGTDETPSPMQFRDIVEGNNGQVCLGGYDMCSGRGAWIFRHVTTLSARGGT